MLTTQPIATLMDNLPTSGVTVYMLQGLDFVVPGQWQNISGFENMIRLVTGETNPARLKAIAHKAQEIYADPTQGYQRAMWLYQTVDTADQVLAAAAMANKIGEKISFLSFINRLTPKSDMAQAIDFSLKLTSEMLAYGLMHGLPRDGISQFAQSLATYSQENIMRLTALISGDGILPLGPDFLSKIGTILGGIEPGQLQNNAIYQRVSSLIPGSDTGQQLGFIQQLLAATQTWLTTFQTNHNLSPQVILGSLQNVIQVTDESVDYVAAFLDATTNYYEHTGTQSIARHLISRAAAEVPLTVAADTLAPAVNKPISDDKKKHRQPDQLIADLSGYLQALNYEYQEIEADTLAVAVGGTTVYVMPFAWEGISQPLLEIRATIAEDVAEISKKAGRALLETNAEIPFGSLLYVKEQSSINLSYTMPSQVLNQNSLAVALEQVAAYAADLVP